MQMHVFSLKITDREYRRRSVKSGNKGYYGLF
jgi:hypothetical protein